MISANTMTSVARDDGGVRSAIASAAAKTGVDFNYLLGQAQIESGLRPNAKARTSSATGLYQFIDASWLSVVKDHGAKHGVAWAADAIGKGGRVATPQLRQAILDLRKNPHIASALAAEHASDNKRALEAKLGRTATGADLYMAHFLGLGGAKAFLTALDNNARQPAAALFPSAARANRGVFYASSGQARSLGEIYERFSAKLGQGVQLAGKAVPGTPGVGRARLDTATLNRMELARISGEQEVIEHPSTAEALTRADLLRPTPANAKLAYLMLAGLGN